MKQSKNQDQIRMKQSFTYLHNKRSRSKRSRSSAGYRSTTTGSGYNKRGSVDLEVVLGLNACCRLLNYVDM